MATITKFEDLRIWQLARVLAQRIYTTYSASEAFQKDYKLREQINAASGSIMDNIAEGFERDGRKEFINFLSIAKGSCGEVKSQLYRAFDRNYLSNEQFRYLVNQTEELGRKIGAFMKYLRATTISGTKFKSSNAA